jgi:hypothetical protein
LLRKNGVKFVQVALLDLYDYHTKFFGIFEFVCYFDESLVLFGVSCEPGGELKPLLFDGEQVVEVAEKKLKFAGERFVRGWRVDGGFVMQGDAGQMVKVSFWR